MQFRFIAGLHFCDVLKSPLWYSDICISSFLTLYDGFYPDASPRVQSQIKFCKFSVQKIWAPDSWKWTRLPRNSINIMKMCLLKWTKWECIIEGDSWSPLHPSVGVSSFITVQMRLSSPMFKHTWASPLLIVQLTLKFSVGKVSLGLFSPGRSVSFSSVFLPGCCLRGEPAWKLLRLLVAAGLNCAALPLKKGKASSRSRRPLFRTLHRSL